MTLSRLIFDMRLFRGWKNGVVETVIKGLWVWLGGKAYCYPRSRRKD